MSRVTIAKWMLLSWGMAALFSTAVLFDVEPPNGSEAPLFELLGDNEMPSPIMDDLLEIAGEVAAFLIRMVPGI